MISKVAPSSAKSRPLIFCADCELDHIHPRITGARWGSPDGASRFQCPGVGKVAWRYTALAALFFVPGPLAAVPPLGPCEEDADRLSESKKRPRCDNAPRPPESSR